MFRVALEGIVLERSRNTVHIKAFSQYRNEKNKSFEMSVVTSVLFLVDFVAQLDERNLALLGLIYLFQFYIVVYSGNF